jgi:TPR repeat protein
MQSGFPNWAMMCSTGQSMPLDMVSAHKWFNIAAMLGMKDAVRLRNEIAAEMSDREITTAQRAALRADRATAAEAVKRSNVDPSQCWSCFVP